MATDDRIAYLASGFALGELDNDELRELYEALRGPGEGGREAARITWRVLGTTVDLRAAAGTQFQDTVAHRLTEEARPGDDTVEIAPGRDFMGDFLKQMGTPRPRLEGVATPGPGGRKLRLHLPLALAALAAVAAAAFAIGRAGPEVIARVTSVKGEAMVEGEPVFVGTSLDRRPVIVASGGSIILEWRAGHAVEAAGPANLVPQGEGLSVSSGVVRAFPGRTLFTLGLPDLQVACGPGSGVSVEVVDNRSVIGVGEGEATLVVGGRGKGAASRTKLEKGTAAALGRGGTETGMLRFRWLREAAFSREGDAMLLESDPDAAVWRFGATVVWEGLGGAAAFTGAGGAGWVRLLPGAVVVRAPEGNESVHALSGAPLLARRVEMAAPPGGEASLRIEGLRRPLRLPFARAVREIRLDGGARLTRVEFHTGPPPLPR